MAIPDHILEEIKARIPLSGLVGREVRLKARGPHDHWGLSPFTPEKTPSFHVRDDQNFYHCFSTGEHGNHFSWLMQRQNLSFFEAVKQLAEEAGVTLPQQDPQEKETYQQKKTLYEVMEFATDYYQSNLQGVDGGSARAWLEQRSLTPETVQHFKLGLAPANEGAKDEDRLIKAAKAKGIDRALLFEAGLLRQSDQDSNKQWALFKNRIMFPIEDVRGRVIAFGGRFLGDASAAGVGKYINSPQTPLFDKSLTLYHFAPASKRARQTQRLIVAEGYMDVISLWQAGFDDAVAPLGTAVTNSQLLMLWRMVDQPIFCLDGDQAGTAAAVRAARRSLEDLQPGKSLAFAFMPVGEDPDSYLKTHGKEAMQAILTQTTPLERVLVDAEAAGLDLTRPDQKALFEKQMNGLVAQIGDETVKRHFRYALRSLMWEALRQQNPYHQQRNSGYNKSAKGQRRPAPNLASRLRKNASQGPYRMQQILLSICLNHPELIHHYGDELSAYPFTGELNNLRGDMQLIAREQAFIAMKDDKQQQYEHLHNALTEIGHYALLEQLEQLDLKLLVPQIAPNTPKQDVITFLDRFFDQRQQAQLQTDILSQLKVKTADHSKLEGRIHHYQKQYAATEAALDLDIERLGRAALDKQ